MKLALAQVSSRLGDVDTNAQKHRQYINRARQEGAKIVAFPELSLTGYLLRDLAYELSDASMRAIRELANQTTEFVVLVGFVEEWRRGIFRNSMPVISNGSLHATVPKMYLPTYGLFEEKRYFKEGEPEDLRIFQFDDLKYGVTICEDAWHPEPLEILSKLGADLVFVTAGSPARAFYETKTGKLPVQEDWERVVCTRALENNIYVAFVNRVGEEDEEFFWGGSMVATPFGELAAQARLMDEDLLVVDVNPSEVARARRFSSFRDHRTELHSLLERLP